MIANSTQLHCRRCNQRVQAGEQYTVSRSHGGRIATHHVCADPSLWTQCALLEVAVDGTQTQCQAVADGRTGDCEAHNV